MLRAFFKIVGSLVLYFVFFLGRRFGGQLGKFGKLGPSVTAVTGKNPNFSQNQGFKPLENKGFFLP